MERLKLTLDTFRIECSKMPRCEFCQHSEQCGMYISISKIIGEQRYCCPSGWKDKHIESIIQTIIDNATKDELERFYLEMKDPDFLDVSYSFTEI